MGGRGHKRFRNLEHMIADTLVKAGAEHIRFNPLTSRACVKVLQHIAGAEGAAASDACLSSIVQSSQCDLFHAIQALRMHVLGQGVQQAAIGRRKRGRGAVRAGTQDLQHNQQTRDMSLDLFHALGKILYNKRYDASGELVQAGARCAPRLDSLPLRQMS
jgi:DNA polymerase III delta prime subunit